MRHHTPQPGGLHVEQAGYAFELLTDGSERTLNFVIRAPDGRALERFARLHGRELHLMLVSRDLSSFAHLHPTRDAGSWSVALSRMEPGADWVYADFAVVDGPALTLRRELSVPGTAPERGARSPSNSARVNGFSVHLQGALEPGSATTLTFHVSSDGSPVPLEPYLGANGHLVAIRDGDGAFLHVHPRTDHEEPGQVGFSIHPPLGRPLWPFLDFQTQGRVHTAAFTVDVAEGPSAAGAHA